MTKVYLNKTEDIDIINGTQWIFSNEINHFEGEIKSGETCEVYSYQKIFLGIGFLNTSSKIMIRMLTNINETIDKAFFKKRLEEAWLLRKNICLTSTCRVVFSEADFLPGLIVDKYEDYLVIQILSLAMETYKKDIVSSLIEIFQPLGIYERSDVSVRLKEGLEEYKGVVYGEFNPLFLVHENDIKMYVDLENGQKTGYFLDQKTNRLALKPYVKDKIVLDCFSHTGGFALHALKFEARKVYAVDISEKACQDILKNAKLNEFDNIEVICDDVFNYLRKENNKNKYDVIILDPPAFTKAKDTVKNAYKGYKEINLQALKMIKSGGILFTFSCSMHMTEELFKEMLKDAINDSKRKVRLLDFRMQSPDHPVFLENSESLYLKCAILYVI